MEKKVLLILVDGMRPDSIPLCGDESFESFFKAGTYCMKTRSVYPSMTLPCHMSLFHSVDPGRHGTTTNIYAPQVRPVNGLVEVLAAAQKTSAFVYTWEELRDCCRPGNHLEYSWFVRQRPETVSGLEIEATAAAKELIKKHGPDFVFLYLGATDEWGHRKGWMSQEYLNCVRSAWNCIQDICADLPEEYTVIVTADHGGHDRIHGTEMTEDMTVPVTIHGADFPAGKELEHCDVRDLAPTIVEVLGLEADDEWEGNSILRRV